jgi:hypothetical protein
MNLNIPASKNRSPSKLAPLKMAISLITHIAILFTFLDIVEATVQNKQD